MTITEHTALDGHLKIEGHLFVAHNTKDRNLNDLSLFVYIIYCHVGSPTVSTRLGLKDLFVFQAKVTVSSRTAWMFAITDNP